MVHEGILYYSEADSGFGRTKRKLDFVNRIFEDFVKVGCLLQEKKPDIKTFFKNASTIGRYFLAAMTHDKELKADLQIHQVNSLIH